MFNRATLLALAAAAVATPTPDAEPMHLPFTRRGLAPLPDGTVDWAAFFTEVNNTLIKYKAGHHLLPLSHYMDESLFGEPLQKRATKDEPLTDQVLDGVDLAYYGNGRAGGQEFTIDFDTGSADFFVPGPNCDSGCKGTPYSDSGINQHKTTSVTYGSGQVSGNNYFDTVCVAGLCAPHTNLISLTTAQGFSTLASNSLMGMGFSTIAESMEPTFFERLMALNKVTRNEFSFYLGRNRSHTTQFSQLTLGGQDSTRYTGKITHHKVTKKGYWQVAVDGVSVKGRKSILSKGQAAIDTGTTAIIAPTVAATALFLLIPGAVPLPFVATGSLSETAFLFPCGFKGPIQIIFGGKRYGINPADLSIGQLTPGLLKKFNLPIVSGGLCAASIIAADLFPGQNFYVVGDSFLKNWYSIYNYNNGGSVSFAAAKGNQ